MGNVIKKAVNAGSRKNSKRNLDYIKTERAKIRVENGRKTNHTIKSNPQEGNSKTKSDSRSSGPPSHHTSKHKTQSTKSKPSKTKFDSSKNSNDRSAHVKALRKTNISARKPAADGKSKAKIVNKSIGSVRRRRYRKKAENPNIHGILRKSDHSDIPASPFSEKTVNWISSDSVRSNKNHGNNNFLKVKNPNIEVNNALCGLIQDWKNQDEK